MPTAHDTWLAVHRFGVGAKPGEPARIGADPRAWLNAQVRDPAAFAIPAAGMPTRQEAAQALLTYRAGRQAQEAAPAPTMPDMPNQPGSEEAAIRALFQELRGVPIREATAKFHRALRTDTGFAERLVWFWSNHFTMAATQLQTIPYPGMFERGIQGCCCTSTRRFQWVPTPRSASGGTGA